MIEQTITIDSNFVKFISQCFGSADFENQHDQCDVGRYPLQKFIDAYYKYISNDYVFYYNCSDCSFPKFRNIVKDEEEACPICGD